MHRFGVVLRLSLGFGGFDLSLHWVFYFGFI